MCWRGVDKGADGAGALREIKAREGKIPRALSLGYPHYADFTNKKMGSYQQMESSIGAICLKEPCSQACDILPEVRVSVELIMHLSYGI